MTVFSFISSVFYRLSYLIHAVQVCNIKATFQPSMNGMIMNKNSYSLTMKNNDDEKNRIVFCSVNYAVIYNSYCIGNC